MGTKSVPKEEAEIMEAPRNTKVDISKEELERATGGRNESRRRLMREKQERNSEMWEHFIEEKHSIKVMIKKDLLLWFGQHLKQRHGKHQRQSN